MVLLTDVGGKRVLESAGGRRTDRLGRRLHRRAGRTRHPGLQPILLQLPHARVARQQPAGGDKFWEGFTQKTVGDLLTYVRTNMPNGNGGSLPASTYNDLVALILKSNGFPTGTVELAPETVAGVQIIPKDGPGELPANTLVRVIGCLARNGNDWVLTSATAPERIERIGVGAEDASRPLGDRTTTLKFVLTRLDSFVGQRMSVSGMLIGAGGADGINVTTVNRVADTCP